MPLFLCFLGVGKYCKSSSILTSVSTLFVVVRFDTIEIQIEEVVESPQTLVISFCGIDIDHDGTTNFGGGGGGVRPVFMAVFVYTCDPISNINCLPMLWSK